MAERAVAAAQGVPEPIDPRQIDVIDEVTAARWRVIDPARRTILAAVVHQRPSRDGRQVRREVARRLTGDAA